MTTTSPTVWVVAPVHNRRHFTEPFLRCLQRQTYSPTEVIIFDDGSTDGTSDMIRDNYPSVILLHGDGNVWWTASTNRAIRRALEEAEPTDFVLVMNDDVEIDEHFVEHLVTLASHHPRSLVGAVTVDMSGDARIDFGGVRLNRWTAKHTVLNRGRPPSAFQPGHYEVSSLLTGRACLIPVRALREIGLYDERNFLNCGDTELPVRAARNGYELLVSYDAVVRSHIHAMHQENRAELYSVGMLRRYYFDVKSYSRLQYRWHFAKTLAGPGLLHATFYFGLDFIRITAHFLRAITARRPRSNAIA